ncbi:LysR family transcriptional regulator [Woodsholea maritima]|uniref:LysR family transcriptional regulator n=1 Tax=Woodsholea maritima TaxID=240237 RepID=UPI00035C223B|nr:LysR family transcriptional regulator [Woodsholea maritima]
MENWSDYRIFLAIAQTGSHSAAARKLSLSQPTVSRRLAQLEDTLGDNLFLRDRNRLELTPLGEIVQDHALRMQAEVDAISRQIISQDTRFNGPIVIAASDGVGGDWLPCALKGFQDANPGVTLHIDIQNATTNLAGREADIALRWNGPGQQNSLIGRKIATVKGGLYAAKAYLDQAPPIGDIEDLMVHKGIGWRTHGFFPWPKDEENHLCMPQTLSLLTDNPITHVCALARGFGIGVTSHRNARRYGLVHLCPAYTISHDLWIVAHDDVQRNRRIRACFDYLIEQSHKDAPHFRDGAPSIFAPDFKPYGSSE